LNVIITGGTGFVGANLITKFLGLGFEVFYTGRDLENRVNGTCLGCDFSKISWDSLPKIDALLHMAAITDTTVYNRELMFQVNYFDSVSLFKDAISHGCKNIVYASSCSVYGNQAGIFKEDMKLSPLNPYAESKAMLDEVSLLAIASKIMPKIIGLRYSNVYGPNEHHKNKSASMISRLLWQMKEGDPRLFKYGEQKRDWVYYKDVVEVVYLSSLSDKSGVYNIGFGESASFNYIVDKWNQILGLDRNPIYEDNPFEDKYQSITEVNIDKARKELDYDPKYNVDQGMLDYDLSSF